MRSGKTGEYPNWSYVRPPRPEMKVEDKSVREEALQYQGLGLDSLLETLMDGPENNLLFDTLPKASVGSNFKTHRRALRHLTMTDTSMRTISRAKTKNLQNTLTSP